jgi:hypothetical protein
MSVGLQVVFTTCRTTREVLPKYLTYRQKIELIPYQNRLDKYFSKGLGKKWPIF